MAGKSQIKNLVKKVLDVVRREVMPIASPDRTSAANYRGIAGGNGGPAEVTTITTEGTDGEGNPMTRHVFMLDFDALDDEAVYLA